MKKLIYSMILFTLTGLMFSCDDETFQGDSTLSPSSPSVSISVPSISPFVEQDSTITFTVTLSETQIVDVAVYVFQSGGTATAGSDFTFTNRVVIPAYRTSATGVITILSDDVEEETETFELTFGDERTANASITPVTAEFSIMNYTDGDLIIGMSWDGSVVGADGNVIGPTSVADLRLLIVDAMPYTAIFDGADGGSFEEFVMGSDDFSDGEYYVVADFYDAIDLGDQGSVDLDLTVTFDQAGVINGESYSFPAALNTGVICSASHFYMVKITKSGSNYTFESVGASSEYDKSKSVAAFEGSDGDLDGLGWVGESVISISQVGSQYFIDGLNEDFMVNIWGETIQTKGQVEIIINDDMTFEIPSQYIFTTLYSGSLYDYNVYGSGTIDDICTGAMTVNYEMDQDGFLVGDWLHNNGYMTDEIFKAEVAPE